MSWSSCNSSDSLQRIADDPLRLLYDGREVPLAQEALGINLVETLGSRRTGREPSVRSDDLQPANRGVVAGRARQLARDRLTRECGCAHGLWRKPGNTRLLIGSRGRIDARIPGRTQFRRQLPIVLAGILAGARRDLGGEQTHDESVLVGAPDGAVTPQKARTGAFLATEADRSLEQAGREPLEADRHLAQRPLQACNHTIDEPARDECLAYRRGSLPVGTMGEEEADGDGEVVIGIEEARRRGDDAVAVRVGVVGEGNPVAILELQ